jgi:tetratricopeptide (TPR) repeat protein
MTPKSNSVKMIALVLVCSFTGLFLWGCASSQRLSGFFGFWRSKAPISKPTDKELAGFASVMRPAQGNADAHYNLARYLTETGKYKEAIVEFKKVVAIRPESVLAYNGLGVCYDHLGYFRNAKEAYQMALKLDPNLDYVHNNIGCSFLLQEKYDEAIDAFKKAIALNDKKLHYHNNLARTYVLAGRDGLAASEFERGGTEPVMQTTTTQQVDQASPILTASGDQKNAAAGPSQSATDLQPINGRIELLNGNGVNGMARKMRAYLQERGFKVVRCANADNFDYLQTNVYYRGEGSEAAQQLVAQIPEIKNVKEVNRLGRADITVKVVMGKDLKPFKNETEGER